ncbi:hypothetical protein [Erythrobacter sanguineus]|uniref:Uncharacterized protein n=1 Tax=Erythrobacter sanguineus TaxID=198312 RepID=A0A1M7SQM1_9SPHN|nr:hypothetical protein [Erythrobacter sanguineus]SHN60752.1 hypothetical protein SAMN02745193_02184 [Erythrobacter sanguineus]
MTTFPTRLARTTLGTFAAGALAFASATPAMADDRRDRGGIGAGEIIAGTVVIGGIAALAGAFDGDRGRWDRGDRRGWRGDGFRGGSRGAVQRCVRAAENQARRFGGYRFADVTDIRDVDRTRSGFRIRGRIQVEGQRGFRGRDFDRGRFTCRLDGRGAPRIDFDGIRGLR